jgi:hypothetical protein
MSESNVISPVLWNATEALFFFEQEKDSEFLLWSKEEKMWSKLWEIGLALLQRLWTTIRVSKYFSIYIPFIIYVNIIYI